MYPGGCWKWDPLSTRDSDPQATAGLWGSEQPRSVLTSDRQLQTLHFDLASLDQFEGQLLRGATCFSRIGNFALFGFFPGDAGCNYWIQETSCLSKHRFLKAQGAHVEL